jgi:hypothetical protein
MGMPDMLDFDKLPSCALGFSLNFNPATVSAATLPDTIAVESDELGSTVPPVHMSLILFLSVSIQVKFQCSFLVSISLAIAVISGLS